MIRSMTAFGRGEATLGGGTIVAEARTVNSRHLDLRIRLPREFVELEPAIRKAVSRCFSRGKVDVTVRLPEDSAPTPDVTVGFEAAARYVEAADALRARFGLEGTLSLETLLGLPGVVRLREAALEASEAEPSLVEAVEAACRAADSMRQREGAALEGDLSDRLSRVETMVTEIGSRADDVRKGLRERLERRLATLAPQVGLDPSRLDQEVVFYADRMDVTEEAVRIDSHIAQFRESLSSRGPVGRKLEFLLQELARETNTIGSKVTEGELTALVVDLKTELEKLREQVQNVE
jgi:uncharacterized protein (TIGR00255 family)